MRLWTHDGQVAAQPLIGDESLEEFGAGVYCVAVSPDGTRIASGGGDGTVRLWTLEGKPAAQPIEGHRTQVASVAISPDRTRIVAGGWDGTVRMWGLDGFGAVNSFERHDGGIRSINVSADGTRLVTAGVDGEVGLLTLNRRPVARSYVGHSGGVASADFSPNGSRIASGGWDGTVRLWTLDGQPETQPFEGHRGGVISVAFSPSGTLIASGGTDGTVRLWTLNGQPAGEPFRGHDDWVWSVAFSPDGSRIVSGGDDGTVRLWTLNGQPAAQPFEGHRDSVRSVSFSPDGTHIVSGGQDGTVRLWTVQGQPSVEPVQCPSEVLRVQWSGGDSILVWSGDRGLVLNTSLELRGQFFLAPAGWVVITKYGISAPTDDLHAQVRAIGEDGTALTKRGAVAAISAERARQILFDHFTFWERARRQAVAAAAWTRSQYEALGWFKVPFWPALGWVLLTFLVVGTWIVTPHRVAHWAMPTVDSPELPRWRWLTQVITLVGFFGTTRGALSSWVQRRNEQLTRQNFTGRRPVQERARYCELVHAPLIADIAIRLGRRQPVRLWIEGPGGTGKSALAYALLRRSTQEIPRHPVPVLVDEDWGEDLLEHAARLVRLEEESRGPTRRMVRTLGASGELCLLVDSLSERGIEDAEEQLSALVRDDQFRAVVVTSRSPPPQGKVWEAFERVKVEPLTRDQVPVYISTYAPEDQRPTLEGRLAPLLDANARLSPLYLRFAIQRALEGEMEQTSWGALVLDYLERLREDRIDLGPDDFTRACRIAATESLREGPSPRELDAEYLRGVLAAKAEEMPFRTVDGRDEVHAATLVERLVSSGVLNRNRANSRFVQFAYDPVADQLASLQVSESRQRVV